MDSVAIIEIHPPGTARQAGIDKWNQQRATRGAMKWTDQTTLRRIPRFCEQCTSETIAWPAPATSTLNGVGTTLFGGADPCTRCGSVVKRLYFCVLFIPIWPLPARFRIITLKRSITGESARYVGRRFPFSADDPYGLNTRQGWFATQYKAEADAAMQAKEAALSVPAPPSQLAEHPELRGERYQQAEDYWESGEFDHALPVFEEVLAAHEAVLGADDIATLQLRQRMAEVYLEAGWPAAALALAQQTTHHFVRLLAPDHPYTLLALDDCIVAREQLDGPGRAEIKALKAELTDVEEDFGEDHPRALRTACALGMAQLICGRVERALHELEKTLGRSERSLGADHPDTEHVREEFVTACRFAEQSGKLDEAQAAVSARERVHGPDAPETLMAMGDLAQHYASSRRHRGEAVELLRKTLERCERALGPDDPLTADLRRRLEETS
ncbi:tetratricopeptide repeat protein [Actinomadura darangshiensis]|uniref:Tetratricopeptide repeat protein n=1 Tax=Actinomadura darangshiensis TaxID=705336 RepID=A0A4R5B734_9ACTN|nr:tetratricopeptide repeat protein [Actinomadura darangshiensis]TDD80873.1 tetratricopeptide repeat protein [Actinomadura darangshiensis]